MALYDTLIYGHLIYKPINVKVKWVIDPDQMNTLQDFLDWDLRKSIPKGQGRSYAPVVLEVVCRVTMDHRIKDSEMLIASGVIRQGLVAGSRFEFSKELIDEWLVFGNEIHSTDQVEDFRCILRISRDGIRFDEHDITDDVRIIRQQLEVREDG